MNEPLQYVVHITLFLKKKKKSQTNEAHDKDETYFLCQNETNMTHQHSYTMAPWVSIPGHLFEAIMRSNMTPIGLRRRRSRRRKGWGDCTVYGKLIP